MIRSAAFSLPSFPLRGESLAVRREGFWAGESETNGMCKLCPPGSA